MEVKNEWVNIKGKYRNWKFNIWSKRKTSNLDSDVARIYNFETKVINQVIKRNIERFPEEFCFQLTKEEYIFLRSQFVTSKEQTNRRGGNRYLPYVFTEYGIIMLSGLLKSEIAIEVNIKVINAFVIMRKYISSNLIEQKYINNLVLENYNRINMLENSFQKLDEKRKVNEIYFNGQIYDAYSKIPEIFKDAKKQIIIIDSYADNTLLDIIKRLKVNVTIITKKANLLTNQDIFKYNQQYNNLKVIYDNTFHDRYFILDNDTIYHCGASINRIGYKTFSITLISDQNVCDMLKVKLNEII